MATYYMRADGTAANKAAATGPATDASACMNVSVHNGETFSAGDVIVVSHRGGVYRATVIPPSSGSSGSPVTYQAEDSGNKPVLSGMDLQGTWSAAAAPPVLESEQASGTDWNANIGRDSSNYWQAIEYTPDADHDVPQIQIKLEKVGTPTGTVSVEIWDDDSNSPGTIISNGASDTVDVSTVPGTGDWVTFTWSGTLPSLTNGNKFYFVVKHGFTTSASNYIRAQRNGSFTGHYRWRIQSGGTEDDYDPDGLNSRIYKSGVAGTLWETTVATEPQVVFMDGTYGIRVTDTEDLSAEYEWHWASNTLTIYAATDPDSRYTSPGVEIGARDHCLDINGVSYIDVENIRLEGGNLYGAFLRGDETGNHNFTNVEFYGCFEFGIVTSAAHWVRTVALTNCSSSYCGSTGLKLNLRTDGWTVTGWTSDHDGCVDFEFDSGSGEQQWGGGIKLDAANNTDFCINHVLDDCHVTNAGYKRDDTAVTTTGNQKGFGIWLDWLRNTDSSTKVVVRNSTAVGNLLSGFFCEKTNHSEWYNLFSLNNGEYGLRVDADDDDIVDDNSFWNLTLRGNDIGLFMAGGWQQNGTHFVDNTFRNIIISDSTTRAIVGKWGAENDGSRGSGNTYEYILVDAESSQFIEWRTSGAAQVFYDTIAAWEAAATGPDNNVVGDPLFANDGGTTPADYKITAGSPAIGAGVDVGLTTDYFGNAWLSTPDIGAHSYSGENAGSNRGLPGHKSPWIGVGIGI